MSSAKDSSLKHIQLLRQGLLRLHKALLDSERIQYEKKHGRIRTSGEFLKLVTGGAFFAWLHPLSELVVQIDIAFDEEEPPTEEKIEQIVRQAQYLLKPPKVKTAFSKKMDAAIQRSPEVVLLFGEVSVLLVSPTVH